MPGPYGKQRHTAKRQYRRDGKVHRINCKQGADCFTTPGPGESLNLGEMEEAFRQHRRDKGETVSAHHDLRRLSIDMPQEVFDEFSRLAAAHKYTAAKWTVKIITEIAEGRRDGPAET